MDKLEELARKYHKEGNNCSYSLYTSFKTEYELSDDYPAPRSIDGICGAVLVTRDILTKKNKNEYIHDYEEEFLKNYGSLKCRELTGNRNRCNDYIGFSARYQEKILEK